MTEQTLPAPGMAQGHHGYDDDEPKIWGLLAGFEDADGLVAGITKVRAEGYTQVDAYSPIPVADAADALGFPKSEMGVIMFIGGLIGATGGFLMQYWDNSFAYPLNVGGRPYFGWPSFIPITFEMLVLTASLSGLFGLIALCGLPRLNHPLFNVPNFDRASQDRFFLCIEATDPKYDPVRTFELLKTLSAESVEEVPS